MAAAQTVEASTAEVVVVVVEDTRAIKYIALLHPRRRKTQHRVDMCASTAPSSSSSAE